MFYPPLLTELGTSGSALELGATVSCSVQRNNLVLGAGCWAEAGAAGLDLPHLAQNFCPKSCGKGIRDPYILACQPKVEYLPCGQGLGREESPLPLGHTCLEFS